MAADTQTPTPTERALVKALEQSGLVPQSILADLGRKNPEDNALAQALVSEGYIGERQLQMLRADAIHWKFVDLEKEFVGEDVLTLIPNKLAVAQKVIAFFRKDQEIHLAFSQPADPVFQRLLQKRFGNDVRTFLATDSAIQAALAHYNSSFHERISQLRGKSTDLPGKVGTTEDKSVIELVDTLLLHSFSQGASDVHIEPQARNTVVRQRIDGLLRKSVSFSKEIHDRLTQRIKVMANLATDEHALPQDGKLIYWTPQERRVDVRVSIIPTTHGEKIVLRLLVSPDEYLSMETLGCRERDRGILEEETKRSWGMILVTGPTGSGKSTTLYTLIKRLNTDTVNVSTIEDPVEYEIDGANQIQVNEKTGLTFANGLRSLVRQDPNIILVGEIRDRDTANIAVNAAMTGHLVLSTLHTNNAATAIPRLIDMEIEPFLISSMVNIVMAQRLVRHICPDCSIRKEWRREDLAPSLPPEVLEKLMGNSPNITLPEGKGCEKCNGTGYRGRFAIFEILRMSSKIRELVMRKATGEMIQDQALAEGMSTMMDDGLVKVKEGMTSIQELLRVIRS